MPPLRVRLLVAAALAFLVVPSSVEFYTEWLWFREVGYTAVFARTITAKALAGGLGFAVAFAILAGNLWIALNALREPYFMIGPTTAELRPIVIDRRQVRWLAMLVTAGLAGLVGLAASSQWLSWLKAVNAAPFGAADPILGHDVSFYVFLLPLLDFVRGGLLLLVLASFAGSATLYFLAGAVAITPRRGLTVRPPARRHLSLLAAALFGLLAAGAWLEMPRQLLADGQALDGASYVAVHARIPALRVLAVVSLAGVALAALHAFSTANWPLATAGALYLLVSVGGVVYGAALQRLVVAPNEQTRETPYIEHNIAATRRAFALDHIEERELSGDAALTREDITRNEATLANVRLWDHQPLLDTFGQIQEIRTYYDFVSVDNDRYVIDGKYRQIMLSGREINSTSLPNRTWINERLVFTHGYGVAMGPVNEVTQEGLPVLFIKNLPPESTVDLPVKEPSIYFGELSSDHVFVRTRAREFHYPRGDDNVYAEYQGTGGVPIGGFLGKLLFSIRFRSFKTLLSEDITPESRILFHRNLLERMDAVAPFLDYDADPYLVISDGRLVWMCDAYTTSALYPYSSRAPNGVNYIRNSVKITIDAYDGTVTFYMADPSDPIVVTLSRVFRGFFKPLSEMPADLRQHIRYPEGIFGLQTAMYSTFHMTNPAVFYNREDQWEVPAIEDGSGNASPMQPYYTIMRLQGEASEEFIQMLPFTPRRKDNLAAWMVARSDGPNYGKILVFQFPKQTVVFGPRQVVARISQDQVISPQVTLWNQQGSQVIWGTLLVIPIEESLLYVRPLYLRAAGGRIPELKRVIVAHQNQIVMAETLDAAIDQIFGAPPGAAAPSHRTPQAPGVPHRSEATEEEARLAAEAWSHYQRALEAQRQGNWAAYGEEIRKVGDILERLNGR